MCKQSHTSSTLSRQPLVPYCFTTPMRAIYWHMALCCECGKQQVHLT